MRFKHVKQKYRYSALLLKEFVRTDFKVRYQGSALGYLWSLLRPLFLFIILYFIFVYFLRVGHGVPHWPVALLFGIVIWNFFSETTNAGLKAVVGKGGMIRKINFPKYTIILAASMSALINLAINLVVIAVFALINHVPFSWTILFIPIFIVEVFVFGLGCAFFLSTVYVKFRDINFVWDILMQGLFYASAVIFPLTMIYVRSKLATELLLFNPVAQAIQDIRHQLIPSVMPPASHYMDGFHAVIPIMITLIVIFIGGWYFRKQSPYFAENA